jgi:hypothetical protein
VRRLIALLALSLSACWGGATFYTASDARPALPAGTYRAVPSDGKPAETVRVSIRADGMTSIAGKDDGDLVGFASLGGSDFAMWYPDPDDSKSAVYGLFRAEGGHYRLTVPFCERTTAIATAAGATVVKDPKMTTCAFQTRAQLEDGLRHLEGQTGDVVEFIPSAPLPPPRQHKRVGS